MPVGSGMSAALCESSAVCHNSDVSDQLGRYLCDAFLGFRCATCKFLNSSLSVGVMISVMDQLDGSCESRCIPFHHSVDVDSVEGSIPLDMSSAAAAAL